MSLKFKKLGVERYTVDKDAFGTDQALDRVDVYLAAEVDAGLIELNQRLENQANALQAQYEKILSYERQLGIKQGLRDA